MGLDGLRMVLGTTDADRSVGQLLEDAGRRRLTDALLDELVPWADELAAVEGLAARPDAALLVASVLCRAKRHIETALELARSAHTAFVAADDTQGTALSCVVLGILAWWRGDGDEAERWWDQATALPLEGSAARLAPLRAATDLIQRGRLGEAGPEAQQVFALAVLEGATVDEAHATLFTGMVHIDTGDLDRSSDAFLRADDLFRELDDEADCALWPLVHIGLGMIAGRRGRFDEMRAELAQAEELALRLRRPAAATVVRIIPALFPGDEAPDEMYELAEKVMAELDPHVHFLARFLAERSLVEAALNAGMPARALEVAEAGAGNALSALSRAKFLTQVGRARLDLGDTAAAIEALEEAADIFVSEGADLWVVSTLVELSFASPAEASAVLERAYAFTHAAEPAFEQVWMRRPRLVIEIDPPRRPTFRVGGQILALGTKGAQLAQRVVLAGDTGVHWETIAAELWPSETDADKIKSRLTSLTALVRRRLGPDGWRLRRDGPRFSFVALATDVTIHG